MLSKEVTGITKPSIRSLVCPVLRLCGDFQHLEACGNARAKTGEDIDFRMRISVFYGPVTWSRMDPSKPSAKEVFLAIGTVSRLSLAFLCTSPTKPRGFLAGHILLCSPVVVCCVSSKCTSLHDDCSVLKVGFLFLSRSASKPEDVPFS